MSGFDNDVVYAKNGDFTAADNQNVMESNGLVLDGQLWIGSTSLNLGGTHINVGKITSPSGTLVIGYSSPNITIDLTGGAVAIEKINLQSGTTPISPSGGTITFNGAVVAAGTNPVRTDGTNSNTMALEVQISQAIASTDVTKIGLAAFNSNEFSVDANGFVSIIAGGFIWTDVTAATQAMLVENGYITDRGAGVVYTLPATAILGSEIIVMGKLGITTITPNANQQILISSASGTVGVTGTAVGTNVGDCITLIATTSGASTVWRAVSLVGNWTLN